MAGSRKSKPKRLKHKLRTRRDLARHLGVSEVYINNLVDKLDWDETELYRSEEKPKESGGTRPIDEPRWELKYAQRLILHKILHRTQIHSAASGGVKEKRLVDNLLPHIDKPMVANYDLKRCFENISSGQVHDMFLAVVGSPDVARILTRLTTFKGRVP